MDRRNGWTETSGGTTVIATIRGDDPVLRPGLPRSVRAVVSSFDGTIVSRETGTFEVTFSYGLHWDVARIDSRLELRYQQERRDDPLARRGPTG